MGLFGNSSNNNSIPDLSRYDYHYRGSHVKGYNVESGSNATAKQYVRSLSLTGNNSSNLHVKNYPQTRRTIKKPKKALPKSAPVAKHHDQYIADSNRFKDEEKVYDDNSSVEEGEDSYDVVDFDEHNNQYSQQVGEDDVNSGNDEDGIFYSQDRYNSITSVTTTTTTTTKEIDPVTGLETTTKTVETTLPDGTLKTTVIKVQKPSANSRTSSRNNSLVGSPTKNGVKREFHQPMFNGFSSDQYNDGIVEEEEEYVQKTQQRLPIKRHRTNNSKKKLPEYAQNTSSTYSNFNPAANKESSSSSQRMTDAEMYARALEIAREKVMSDPSRILAAQAATQKQSKWKTKKSSKNENVELLEIPQVGVKKHDIPRSLRDDGSKAVVASAVAASTAAVINAEDSNNKKSEVPLKKSKFSLFKIFKKDKSDKNVSLQEKANIPNTDSNELLDEKNISNAEVQNLDNDENVVTKTVDDESESDIEFLPLDEEDKPEVNQVSAEVNQVSAEVHQVSAEVPSVSSELPPVTAQLSEVSTKLSHVSTKISHVSTNLPQASTNLPLPNTEVDTKKVEIPSEEILGNVDEMTEPLTPHPTDKSADLRNHGTHQQEQKVPILKRASFVMASNTVVRDSDYAPEKDINDLEENVSTNSYGDAVEEPQTGEIINDNGNDVTELYNDVPDPMSYTELENTAIEPDVSLLQDVPLLKTMQSENELRVALENLEEADEVNVLKDIGNERYAKKSSIIKSKPQIFDIRNYDESTDSLHTAEQGNIIDTLPEQNVELNEAKVVEAGDIQKVANPDTNNKKVEALPKAENNNPSPQVLQTRITEEKTVLSNAQIKPNQKQPVITLNGPVQMQQQRIEVLPPAEDLQETLHPIESEPVQAEQPSIFETTDSQVLATNLTKPLTGDSATTKKKPKSGGFMSKIVQFSNENYGRQTGKTVNPVKATVKTEQPKKQEKPEKKPSKWKLFKKT